jgi:hypothetical protein
MRLGSGLKVGSGVKNRLPIKIVDHIRAGGEGGVQGGVAVGRPADRQAGQPKGGDRGARVEGAQAAGGNPRAATAAGPSTTRSIHIERREMVASRSAVSHQNGSSGAASAVTVRVTEECEAITDQRARSASGVTAWTRSTNSRPCGPSPPHR